MDILEIIKRCKSCQYKPCKGIYFNGELICLNSDLNTSAIELPKIPKDRFLEATMEINPCLKCGRQPKRRYRAPLNWFECKCGRKGLTVCDFYESMDADSVNIALAEWNKLNIKE